MFSSFTLLLLILAWTASLKILAFQEPLTLVSFKDVRLAGWHTFPGSGGASSGNRALIAVQAAVVSYL